MITWHNHYFPFWLSWLLWYIMIMIICWLSFVCCTRFVHLEKRKSYFQYISDIKPAILRKIPTFHSLLFWFTVVALWSPHCTVSKTIMTDPRLFYEFWWMILIEDESNYRSQIIFTLQSSHVMIILFHGVLLLLGYVRLHLSDMIIIGIGN